MDAKTLHALVDHNIGKIAGVYRLYTQALSFSLKHFVQSPSIDEARKELRKKARELKSDVRMQIVLLGDSSSLEIASARFYEQGIMLSDYQEQYIKTLHNNWIEKIQDQMGSDERTVIKTFNSFVMRAELRAKAENTSFEAAIAAEQINYFKNPMFYNMDNLGRKYKSESFVEVETNWYFHRLINDIPLALKIINNQEIELYNGSENKIEAYSSDDIEKVQARLHPRSKRIVVF